ncbi:Myb-like_protein [Hexamita inflata]|uniref:Myb-like_protein n=1 Tax=Hexamita inflata TaxID=28002 RepID=A0ABP1J9Z4_9EUKA
MEDNYLSIQEELSFLNIQSTEESNLDIQELIFLKIQQLEQNQELINAKLNRLLRSPVNWNALSQMPVNIYVQSNKWTDSEQAQYLECLKTDYLMSPSQMASHIASKTYKQIISHSQKFFSKLTRHFSAEISDLLPSLFTLRTKCKNMDRSQIQSAVQLLHPRISQQQTIEVGTCRCRYLCVLDSAIHVGRVAFNRYISQNLHLDQNLILNKILQVLIIVGEPTISIKYVADKLGLNADLVTLVVLNSFIGSSYKLVF